MSEIKPCPFCNNRADYWEDSQYQDRHVIECSYCGTTKRSEYGYDDVLKDWNRRFDSQGREIKDIKKLRYTPALTARIGYRLDGSGEYEDVLIWEGASVDSADMAFKKAQDVAKEVHLIAGTRLVTEGD